MSYYTKIEPEIVVDIAADTETVALTSNEEHIIDPMNTGFTWYIPPMANPSKHYSSNTSNCEWNIAGHDMQVLTMTVQPNETIVTEVGSFMFGSNNIEMNVELTCCSKDGGGCDEGCQRICGGESCVKLLLDNKGSNPGVRAKMMYVGLTPNFPAKIIPIQFGKHIDVNHALLAQPGSYMSHIGNNVNVGCKRDCNCMLCCCAGFGLCQQRITGTQDDIAFIAAGGTIIYRKLLDNEVVIVDTRSVLAMEESVKLGIVSNGRFCTCCCGGEGCCSTTLTGPGKIFLQSMSFTKFQEAVQVTIIDDRGSQTATASN